MKKLLSLFKKKDGVVLMTAVVYMTLAIALCALITTSLLLMVRSQASYSTVNENKIIADQIAADYMDYVKTQSVVSVDFAHYTNNKYSDYSIKCDNTQYTGTEANYAYHCYVYEEDGDTTAIIYIEINSNCEYTRYEYGNI